MIIIGTPLILSCEHNKFDEDFSSGNMSSKYSILFSVFHYVEVGDAMCRPFALSAVISFNTSFSVYSRGMPSSLWMQFSSIFFGPGGASNGINADLPPDV